MLTSQSPQALTLAEINWSFLQDELTRLRLLLIRFSLWQDVRATQPDLAMSSFYHDDARAHKLTNEIEAVTTQTDRAREQCRILAHVRRQIPI